MFRRVHLPAVVYLPAAALTLLVTASCASTPPTQENVVCKQGVNGVVCEAVSTGTTAAPSSGNTTGIPNLGQTTIPQLGNSTTPSVSPTSTSTTGGTPTSQVPTSAPVTGDPTNTPTVSPTSAPTTGAPTDSQTPTSAVPTSEVTDTTSPASGLATITVSAGTLARDHSIVTFPFPAGHGKALVLKDAQGTAIPIQMSPLSDDATFVLPALAAGEQTTYTVEQLDGEPVGITAAQDGQHLMVSQGANKVFRWTLVVDLGNKTDAAARDQRAGYIYPLYTPGGLNVAGDYQPDHPHMHGIWSAWTSTTFRGHAVDFWNGYANQGRVDLKAMEGLWGGSVHAGLIANLSHQDITVTPPVEVLKEKWIVTIYKTHETGAPYYVFDIDSTQETATSDPLVLEQYHYGGFGYRGAEEWADVSKVSFLTSEGHTRADGDGKTGRWVAQYGTVGGQPGGYAAFDHPTNPRHPQGLRIHPTNPYWSFTSTTPSAGGRATIEVGVPYKSKYRIISFDGAADATTLNRLWDDFATPPTVQVSP